MVDLLMGQHATQSLDAHIAIRLLYVPRFGVGPVVGEVVVELPADLLDDLVLGVGEVGGDGFEAALGWLAGDLWQFHVALVFVLLILHLFY